MLERFARGKQPTQKNPLLAIVITPRKNRKFSVNFRMPLIYCKTLLVHTAVKDRLQVEGKMIPWLKVPAPGHCTFLFYPCTHQNQVWEGQQCPAHYQTSQKCFEQTFQGRSQGDQAVLPTCSQGQHSFHGTSGTGTSWASQTPSPSHLAAFADGYLLQWSANYVSISE